MGRYNPIMIELLTSYSTRSLYAGLWPCYYGDKKRTPSSSVEVSSPKRCDNGAPFLGVTTLEAELLVVPSPGAMACHKERGACVIDINSSTYTCIRCSRFWTYLWLRWLFMLAFIRVDNITY